MIPDPEAHRDLAPYGQVRIAINLGNSALAARSAPDSALCGIAIDLSHALASESGLRIGFVTYQSAGRIIEALATDAWDVAFLAIDQQRRAQLAFSPPYMQLEGRLMVRSDSQASDLAGLDRPGARIAVTAGSAYEAHLKRHVTLARLLEYPTPIESFEAFLSLNLEAAAGIGPVLRRFAARTPGVRILDSAFMAIDHGIAVPVGRTAGAKYLFDFVARRTGAARGDG